MNMMMENSREEGDERRGVKRKIALSSCDVCETEEAKYRCPCCTTHTCSLACVKRHKMESGCCGVRDKTAFVPLAEFNEINLLNDYRFLEDTARLRQQSNRDAVLLSSRRHPKEKMWMIRKAKAAKVTLKFLPKIFSKHRENRTVFRNAEGRFHWFLKIHFPQSDAVYSERFPDDKQLDQILNDYIHPSQSDPVKRQRLKIYVQNPQENIRVFLKQEQPDSPRCVELDLKKSLRENLMHKTIVEFPEVFVVLKPHIQEFLARVSGRSGAVPCVASASVSSAPCSPDEPRAEALVCVLKRTRVAEDDELEEGELRTDEEEGSAEDGDGQRNLPETENKVQDERELHYSVPDAPGDADQSQEHSGNSASAEFYTSRSGEMMLVCGDAEALIDEGFSLHDCQQNLPEDDGDGHCGAKQDQEGKIDSERDFSQTHIDNSPISARVRCDASAVEGQGNPDADSSEKLL